LTRLLQEFQPKESGTHKKKEQAMPIGSYQIRDGAQVHLPTDRSSITAVEQDECDQQDDRHKEAHHSQARPWG
jgi:hypothetical protein